MKTELGLTEYDAADSWSCVPQHLHLFNFDSFKLIGSPPGRVHRIPGVHCGTERECPRPSGPGLGRVHVCRLDEGTCRRCRAARAQQTVARALLFFLHPCQWLQ
jgi:hypothetical protein